MSTATNGSRRCIACDRPGPFTLKFQARAKDYRMVSCPDCGLVFQDPQPGDDVLEVSYYHDTGFSHALLGPLRELTLTRAREKLPLLRSAGAVRAGLRVLDVGCSSGAWLEVAAEQGMDAIGIELGEQTSEDARRRGLDVRTGTLERVAPQLEGERFDLITFWDVLEHLRDPRLELSLAAQLLNPGGIVAATFPNVAGWYPSVTYRLLATRTGTWEYPELPVHLYDFAPSTARRLLERTGYRVVAMRTCETPFDHYRQTTLSPAQVGGGRRGAAIKACYEALRIAVYPAARVFDRGNTLFVAGTLLDEPA